MNTLELILDNQFKLDFTDEIELGLVYQIADIREYDKRKSSYSYPFTLPGSHNNNEAFGFIYNVQNDTQFDPNIRASFRVQINTDIIFTGFLQLNRILLNNDTGSIQYEVTAYSNILNLFETIDGRKVCDLDLSEFNHDYLRENVIASWDNYIWQNGVKTPFQKGLGYVYPYVNYWSQDAYMKTLPAPNKLKTEFFYPHPYVRTIWDKIFNEAGFSYTSNFLTGDVFNSLIVSPNPEGLAIDKDLAKQFDFKAKLITDSFWNDLSTVPSWVGFGKFPYNYDSDGQDPPVYSDFGSHFDTTTHTYTVTEKCRMSFYADVKVKILYSQLAYAECAVVINSYLGDEWLYAFLIRNRNGVETTLDSIILKTPVNFTTTRNCTYFNRVTSVSCNDVEFLPGDEIYVKVDLWNRVKTYDGVGAEMTPFYKYWTIPADFSGNITNTTLNEGNPIDFNKILYCDSQSDFLLSIIRMFNLYIVPDPDDERRLIIEPRDDFYDSGYTVDWTKKLDRSQQWELTPIPEVSTSKLILKYSSDSDYLNEDYQNNYVDETFGQYESNFRNDWQTTEEINQIIFANSPLVNEVGTDRIVPEIYKYTNSKKVFSPWKIRIFYYYGLVDTNSPYYIYTAGQYGYTSGSQLTKYPYAGYLDKPENSPMLDLNFYFPNKVYFAQTQITANNLFNLYWRNYLENIYDKNAKMLTGKFYLTPYDIHILNLRHYVYVDGVYWFINKIDGFDPLRESLTTVELISVINQASPKEYGLYENILYGLPPTGTGNWFGMALPTTNTFTIKDINSLSVNIDVNNNNYLVPTTRGNLVAGDVNYIHQEATKSLVLGDNNEVGTPRSSIILGDNNQIGNFEKSILIGDDFGGLTQSLEFKMIVGTGGSYSSASLIDMVYYTNLMPGVIQSIGSYSSGITYSIPFYYSGLSYSNLFYDTSNPTYSILGNNEWSIEGDASKTFLKQANGMWDMSIDELHLSQFNPSTPPAVWIDSATSSGIVFNKTTGGGTLGEIAFLETSVLKGKIKVTDSTMILSSYTDMILNVNGQDCFRIGYGPNVGIITALSGVLFNINDNGWNSDLFRITSTSSTTLLSYDNSGILTNKNHIKLGLTSSGYVLKSPDGTDWKISVDNSGTLIVGTSI